MRIALVSEHANPLATVGSVDAGGQNVHVAGLAAELTGRGHEVTVFTRRDNPFAPVSTAAPGGYRVELVPAGPSSDVPKDELLQYMPEFAAYLRARWHAEPYDVAHAHFWMSGLAASRAASETGIPLLQTFHALGTVKRRQQGEHDTSPRARIAVERQLCQRVDRVIATCRDEVDELVAMGMSRARATIIPCGVDTELFRPLPADPHHRHRILVIGRLVERKGIADAVRALAELPDAELVVAGGPARDFLDADPEVARLRGLAEQLAVADRVRFLGAVSRPDVPQLMAQADVVVAAPWYEPFGIVPLEAMACGRPVVGTAVGGLLDTICPGRTGELVPPRRPDLLARALAELLADEDRRRAYGEAGRARAVSRYDHRKVAEATEGAYLACLSDTTQPLAKEASR